MMGHKAALGFTPGLIRGHKAIKYTILINTLLKKLRSTLHENIQVINQDVVNISNTMIRVYVTTEIYAYLYGKVLKINIASRQRDFLESVALRNTEWMSGW